MTAKKTPAKKTPDDITLKQDIRLQLVTAYLQGAGGEVAPSDQVIDWFDKMIPFILTGEP